VKREITPSTTVRDCYRVGVSLPVSARSLCADYSRFFQNVSEFVSENILRTYLTSFGEYF